MTRSATRCRKAVALPLSGCEPMFTLCEMAEGARERGLPPPLLLPVELDPAVEAAVEQLDRAVAAILRLLAGTVRLAIVHGMLVPQASTPWSCRPWSGPATRPTTRSTAGGSS